MPASLPSKKFAPSQPIARRERREQPVHHRHVTDCGGEGVTP
jgi:hypothetical protein